MRRAGMVKGTFSERDGKVFYTATLLANNRPIKFIVYSRSTVSLIPQIKFNITPTKPVEREYKDVNDNRMNFVGETLTKVVLDGKKLDLELLITRNKTNPLLGLDWMDKLEIKLEMGKAETKKHLLEDEDTRDLKRTFEKVFTGNHTV